MSRQRRGGVDSGKRHWEGEMGLVLETMDELMDRICSISDPV